MPLVATELIRVLSVQKALIGTTIIVLAVVGTLEGDYYLNPKKSLRGQYYTPYEYDQIKMVTIQKIKNRNVELPTFEEAELWKDLLRQECQNIRLTNVKSHDDIIEKLNQKLESGC